MDLSGISHIFPRNINTAVTQPINHSLMFAKTRSHADASFLFFKNKVIFFGEAGFPPFFPYWKCQIVMGFLSLDR